VIVDVAVLAVDENPLLQVDQFDKAAMEGKGQLLTSSPRDATVFASACPGNANHCPMLGPSFRLAFSKDN
jgi:hypothetical protein